MAAPKRADNIAELIGEPAGSLLGQDHAGGSCARHCCCSMQAGRLQQHAPPLPPTSEPVPAKPLQYLQAACHQTLVASDVGVAGSLNRK